MNEYSKTFYLKERSNPLISSYKYISVISLFLGIFTTYGETAGIGKSIFFVVGATVIYLIIFFPAVLFVLMIRKVFKFDANGLIKVNLENERIILFYRNQEISIKHVDIISIVKFHNGIRIGINNQFHLITNFKEDEDIFNFYKQNYLEKIGKEIRIKPWMLLTISFFGAILINFFNELIPLNEYYKFELYMGIAFVLVGIFSLLLTVPIKPFDRLWGKTNPIALVSIKKNTFFLGIVFIFSSFSLFAIYESSKEQVSLISSCKKGNLPNCGRINFSNFNDERISHFGLDEVALKSCKNGSLTACKRFKKINL